MAAFTVALVGPDGVGKTTLARLLEEARPERIKHLYMGDNVASFTHALPTTRWWRSRKARRRSGPEGRASDAGGNARGIARAVRRSIRKTLGFANRIADETYRQWVAGRFVRRGFVVVFDRHFTLDYGHADARPGGDRMPLKRRLLGALRRRLLAPPDLVIVLDAPGDVVFRRKGEFSPKFLEERRKHYLRLRNLRPNTVVVDASREIEVVLGDVREAIDSFAKNRSRDR